VGDYELGMPKTLSTSAIYEGLTGSDVPDMQEINLLQNTPIGSLGINVSTRQRAA
jgi:hypothetical protein